MTTTMQTMTAEELLRIPRDGWRHELVRGVYRRMAPAGNEHGQVALRFAWRLAQYVEANDWGATYAAETGFLLASDPDTVRAPDVAFVRRERLEELGRVEGYWPGAPDLLVEVVSPHDHYTEVEEKVSDWLEAGARMVAVVNPRQRTVGVYRSLSDILVLQEGEVLDGGDVVPGCEVAVGELFV